MPVIEKGERNKMPRLLFEGRLSQNGATKKLHFQTESMSSIEASALESEMEKLQVK